MPVKKNSSVFVRPMVRFRPIARPRPCTAYRNTVYSISVEACGNCKLYLYPCVSNKCWTRKYVVRSEFANIDIGMEVVLDSRLKQQGGRATPSSEVPPSAPEHLKLRTTGSPELHIFTDVATKTRTVWDLTRCTVANDKEIFKRQRSLYIQNKRVSSLQHTSCTVCNF